MAQFRRLWIVSILVALAAMTGCQPKAQQERTPRDSTAAGADVKPTEQPAAQPAKHAKKAHHAAAHKPKPEPPPPPPTIPKVFLSDALRATCLVNVGDIMPDVELPDPAGNLHGLGSLYGRKLTVVCFWTAGTTLQKGMVATALLQDLMTDVAEPFGKKGVAVIGIDAGDPADEVKQHVTEAGAAFPNLMDGKGVLFGKVASDRKVIPRIYLLDAGGKILWFDVEYSRSTRRDLVQAIRVALGELK